MTAKEFDNQKWRKGMICLYDGGRIWDIIGVDFVKRDIKIRGTLKGFWIPYKDIEIISRKRYKELIDDK